MLHTLLRLLSVVVRRTLVTYKGDLVARRLTCRRLVLRGLSTACRHVEVVDNVRYISYAVAVLTAACCI